MGREELEVLSGGVVKRKVRRKMGLFIDGTGLDRATRRLDRKVDMSRLVKGLTSGLELEVAKYYTLIPYEDDARQLAFLDAISKSGLEITTKRLPPKNVKRMVSMDVHIAADLISYACGKYGKVAKTEEGQKTVNDTSSSETVKTPTNNGQAIKRLAMVVCPSREISYAIHVSHEFGVEVSLADFGLYGHSEGWSGVDRWIDLSTSETIWR